MANNNSKGSLIPTLESIVDKTGNVTMRWLQFFQYLLDGDSGTLWSPEFVGLISTGAPNFSGVFYENLGFVDFYARITPGIDTSSVSGSTYLNLPFQPSQDTTVFVNTDINGVATGLSASLKRVWMPQWDNIISPITVSGRVPIIR